MAAEDLRDWIAFQLLDLAPVHQAAALSRIGPPGEVAWRASDAALRSVARRDGAALAERVRRLRSGLGRRVDRELSRCRRLGIRPVTLDDPCYPTLLKELPDPPAVLHVRGVLAAEACRVAVVGSRRATSYGTRTATQLGLDLARCGVQVISGGARGVDAAAHQGALGSAPGTVAVLGNGLAEPYPPEHARLFAEIAESGAVVSEYPLDAEPLPGRFPRRNRIIAGLSAAVVVVEAAVRSGALSTARQAADHGREVLAVPGPIGSDRSAGCHRLIQAGAKLVVAVDDILEELPPSLQPPAADAFGETGPAPGASEGTGATPDEAAVLRILDPVEPMHVDQIAERVPFGIGRLQAALFGLELRGAVDPLPGRYYCCAPRKER